jgi:hypothetical protein
MKERAFYQGGPVADSAHTKHPMLFLTEGGPTYRIEKRLGLIREQSPRIVRRALLSIFLTWVPLLVLCLLQGTALGHSVAIPFLRDYSAYTRFLLALPLLLAAETVLGPHIAHASTHFIHAGVVIQEDFERFDDAVARGLRLRDSGLAEAIIVVLAYGLAFTMLTTLAVQVSTWYAIRTSTGFSLTLAGWWFVFFCVPLFQFLLLRWVWRIFLWGQFLWRVSKLNLQLIPTHPDESGGIAFVGEAHRFFAIILMAGSISIAGALANDVVYDKIPLLHFAPLIAALVIASAVLILLPLCVFTPILLRTKRMGLYKYGSLATEYTSSFHKKWIETSPPREEGLLGTGDIQSLADLGNSFKFIEEMGPMPMDKRAPLTLVLAGLIPMVPLLLTMMPLDELLKMIAKMIL